MAYCFRLSAFRTGGKIGKALRAFTNERDERTVGEDSGKYIIGKCMERESDNPVSFVCLVKSKIKTMGAQSTRCLSTGVAQ